jgi:DMSO/TMAO reductase YedYZ molybdopterin-dependent catalytic subunit
MTRPHRSLLHTGVVAGVLLAMAESTAAIWPALPSPTASIASRLVTGTPGPLATWFLGIFRGAARPLTIAAAAVGLLLALTVILRIIGPLRVLRQHAASDDAEQAPPPVRPVIQRRALIGGLGAGGLLLGGMALLLRPAGGSGALGGARPGVPTGPPGSPTRTLPPLSAGQDASAVIPGLPPTFTPVTEFFRIDTAIRIPQVDVTAWRLRIHGRVASEVVLDFDDLVALGLEEHDVTLSCVSNEVGGDLVGTARWTGVPLTRVLESAGIGPDAQQLVGRSIDGWTAGFPLSAVRPGALVAVGMNGVELPARHGYPARLVVPGLFGYVSATKWLTELELTRWDEFDAYWIRRGWAKRGPMKPMARIDVPSGRVDPGLVTVAGVAWAPPHGVAGVEVSIDDGPWQPATCSDPVNDDVWRQWWLEVPLVAGTPTVRARAIDGTGARQPEGPRSVLPDGAEGWHRRVVRVG